MDTLYDHEDFNEMRPSTPGKALNIYRNGNPSTFITLQLKDNADPMDSAKYLQEKFKFQSTDKLRIFTTEGVEVYPEDFKYLKNDSSIFVSKGENFHKGSKLCEYIVMRKIGEGSFGEVNLAAHKITKQLVAIKFLKKPDKVDAMGLDRFFGEAETLKQLSHRNIVEIINCFTLKDMQIALVMEYLEGGTLLEYVKSKKRLPEDEARHFFSQMMDAISHCHYNRVVHCDLKMENILLKSKESKDIKLIDFGIAGLKTHFKSKVGGGSFHHMAPEILTGKKKNVHTGIDIWAAGCILYEMVVGRWAFDGDTKEKVKERICRGKISFFELKKELSVDVMDLISKMLEVDVTKRITVRGVLSHPWVMNNKEKSNLEVREPFEIKMLPKTEHNKAAEKEEI